ncbi:MAG: M48 family metallopeptidase [Leptolyngbyaceae cyanobacterium MO_188.B28]|nr:M48 family metallopeptidase [Leptolyngbyaceae cyanobacterium MO_188.B28]
MFTVFSSRHPDRHRRRWLSSLLLSATFVGGTLLATPQIGWAGDLLDLIFQAIQVVQLSNLSDRQEGELGRQINQQLVGGEIRLYRNQQINQYVNGIGQRLARVSSRPDITYTFQVVEDDSINAFATMGGFVYVHTGLIAEADNEAQLASVIAHEIGHIAGRHAVEQMQQMAIAQGVMTAAGLDRNAAVNIGVELALRRPNSRQHEFEADELGVATLQKAGYAPIAAADLLRKLVNQTGSTPAFLSTHPAASDRIEAIEQSIEPGRARVGSGLNGQAYRRRIRVLL